MEHQLNLSRAAKLAGVSRREIQRQIREGKLEVFEGDVKISELKQLYPNLKINHQRELDRVERIRDNAVRKIQIDSLPPEYLLAEQVNRLNRELTEARSQIQSYQHLVLEMNERLTHIQDNCDRQQKQTLGAFINWMMTQYRQQTH